MADERGPLRIDSAVRAFYERAPEETRLETGRSRLEAIRTRELIQRHAPPPPAIVLDVGGAAGAYAFWLAAQGYDVRLVDAVHRLVAIAHHANARAPHRLTSCVVGDARALPAPAACAGIVVLLGPLYHLVSESDRRQALAEAARVLRPDGVVFAAGISRCASALDGLSRSLVGDPAFAAIVDRDLADGQHRNPSGALDYFTTAYFHRPEDLRRELTDSGFAMEGLYGIEGPAWMLGDIEQRLNDDAGRQTVLETARKLESEPSVIGASAHLLAVGRKRRR
jgi:SAM-dependent methyltransferase